MIRLVRAASLKRSSSGVHSRPPSGPAKSSPSLHGTYSCGYQSFAIDRCRSSSRSATGSSSRRRVSSVTWSETAVMEHSLTHGKVKYLRPVQLEA